jgi:hypothetical protein
VNEENEQEGWSVLLHGVCRGDEGSKEIIRRKKNNKETNKEGANNEDLI